MCSLPLYTQLIYAPYVSVTLPILVYVYVCLCMCISVYYCILVCISVLYNPIPLVCCVSPPQYLCVVLCALCCKSVPPSQSSPRGSSPSPTGWPEQVGVCLREKEREREREREMIVIL